MGREKQGKKIFSRLRKPQTTRPDRPRQQDAADLKTSSGLHERGGKRPRRDNRERTKGPDVTGNKRGTRGEGGHRKRTNNKLKGERGDMRSNLTSPTGTSKGCRAVRCKKTDPRSKMKANPESC